MYNGNVLVSTPHRASLAHDAVPSKFPECPAYLSKPVSKHRKRPAVRQPIDVPKKKRAHCSDATVSDAVESVQKVNQPDDVALLYEAFVSSEKGATADLPPHELDVVEVVPSAEGSHNQVEAVRSAFNDLYEFSTPAVVPSESWGCHRLELDGMRNVVFSEMQRSANPKLRGVTTKKNRSNITTNRAKALTICIF